MKLSKTDRDILSHIIKAMEWNEKAHSTPYHCFYSRGLRGAAYANKKANADYAIGLLKKQRHSRISYYTTKHKGLIIHYFSIKVGEQTFQMSVHDPHAKSQKQEGTYMEWDHKDSFKTAEALKKMFKL